MNNKTKLLFLDIITIIIIWIFFEFSKDKISSENAIYIFILVVVITIISRIIRKKMENKMKTDSNLKTVGNSQSNNKYTLKAKWVYDISCDYYCNQTGKSFEQLTQDDEKIIWKYASSELVFILTWLIKNNLYDKEELADYEEKIQKIKNSNILATDINESIDYTLCYEFSDDIIPFFKNYYINYENFTKTILGKEPYSFIGTYDDYLKFEKMINEKYDAYRNNK